MLLTTNRDAKMYKHANNVHVRFSKLWLNFSKILHCFVTKVSYVAISRFLVAFLVHFGTLCNFLPFCALFWSFGTLKLFCPKLDLS